MRRASSHAFSIAAQALSLPPSAPSTGESKSTRSPTAWCLNRWSVRGTISSYRNTRSICPKPSLDDGRRGDDISPATKGWVDTSEKVVEVGCNKPRTLIQSSVRAPQDKCHQQHGPRQPDYIQSDDEEGDLPTPIILRVCVCECQDEGYELLILTCIQSLRSTTLREYPAPKDSASCCLLNVRKYNQIEMIDL